MEIKDYIDEFERIREELKERGYVESVVDVAITILKERGKDRRMSEIAEERKTELADPITDKQKKYIKDLCTTRMEPLPNLSGLSKSDASALIKKMKVGK